MHANAWDKDAFQLQICAIVLAPTIICAGLYLIIKHVALNVDASLSRFRPRLYPIFFLPADVSCLVVQAIGGGLAAAGDPVTGRAVIDAGNRMIIAGICLQVVVLSMFGAVGAEYLLRVARKVGAGGEVGALWFEGRFRIFLAAFGAAFAAVYLRCIYRYDLFSLSLPPV
jgi:hypothetical protein